MKIGIDARKIGDTGIGRYIENLVGELVAADSRHRYVLFMTPGDILRYKYPPDRVTMVKERAGKYSLAEHWSLASKAAAAGIDLFHAPHYVLPYFMRIKSVVTVHDIIHLLDPSFGFAARTYAKVMIQSAIKRAAAVIAVSECAKREIVEKLRVSPDHIRVIPNGGGSDFAKTPASILNETLTGLNLSRGYFLFVGSDRPHKNLKAVAAVMDRMADARFVIVGRVEDKSAFAKFGDRVKFINGAEKKVIETLYTGATALLFPSYHEGFGLPPLEAMACGTPVVASARSSIPEVTGDAAVLVDPDDCGAMSSALAKFATDIAYRDDYVQKGYARLEKFSWAKTAKMTLEVYESV